MTCKLALMAFLSLALASSTIAAPDVVDLALQSIGGGSVTELKRRIFNLAFSVCSAEDQRQAIASLPLSIRDGRISEGKLLRRVKSVIAPVLELHGRSDKIELFLYHDYFPRASVWLGCVLLISDALADPLHDDELAGIVAHEVGHAYFMIDTIKARKNGDRQAMRIIELKCDAVAMLTLRLLSHDPAGHLRGLHKVTNLTKSSGYKRSIDFRYYPSIAERAQFAQRFIKLLS